MANFTEVWETEFKLVIRGIEFPVANNFVYKAYVNQSAELSFVLPKYENFDIDDLYIGDKVEYWRGYKGNLKKRFTGYIYDIGQTSPYTITCYDILETKRKELIKEKAFQNIKLSQLINKLFGNNIVVMYNINYDDIISSVTGGITIQMVLTQYLSLAGNYYIDEDGNFVLENRWERQTELEYYKTEDTSALQKVNEVGGKSFVFTVQLIENANELNVKLTQIEDVFSDLGQLLRIIAYSEENSSVTRCNLMNKFYQDYIDKLIQVQLLFVLDESYILEGTPTYSIPEKSEVQVIYHLIYSDNSKPDQTIIYPSSNAVSGQAQLFEETLKDVSPVDAQKKAMALYNSLTEVNMQGSFTLFGHFCLFPNQPIWIKVNDKTYKTAIEGIEETLDVGIRQTVMLKTAQSEAG